jgi:hypothetical protein
MADEAIAAIDGYDEMNWPVTTSYFTIKDPMEGRDTCKVVGIFSIRIY